MFKIPRLYRDIVVTEKLDGTNAAIYVSEDGEVLAGSKNRWLSPGKATDNFGFAEWVEQHAGQLRELGPGWHRGEWWGVGINRGYGIFERRFTRFNGRAPQIPGLVDAVPVLYEGPFTTDDVDSALTSLAAFGSVAAPGFMRPEGVVVYHKASGHLFKATLENDGVPKGRER